MSRLSCLFVVLCFGLFLGLGCSVTTPPEGGAVALSDATPEGISQPFAELLDESVERLQHEALRDTLTLPQIRLLLSGQLSESDSLTRASAATLVSLGVIDAQDLARESSVTSKLLAFQQVMARDHPDFYGRIGDSALQVRLSKPLSYDDLLVPSEMLDALGKGLTAGVITGYDLRRRGVYDNFPTAQTLIYSQAQLLHMRELVSVLAREGVDAWVYVTPKISAFLYREEWGSPGSHVQTLPSGVKVVQGREMAVLFQFPSAADRSRFHAVIQRYAKRDSEEESGLIAHAWWQPFYYSDTPVDEFKRISLVVLGDSAFEATLTVVEAKAATVVAEFDRGPWQLREDKAWVNPSFFRFLNGDYR